MNDFGEYEGTYMNMKIEEFKLNMIVGIIGICFFLSLVIWGQPPIAIPQPIQVSNVFGLTMDRFDYVITDATQNGFTTTAPLRGNVILVFKNGFLMTVNADYKQSIVAQGRNQVNFVSPLTVGDKVSIVYWR